MFLFFFRCETKVESQMSPYLEAGQSLRLCAMKRFHPHTHTTRQLNADDAILSNNSKITWPFSFSVSLSYLNSAVLLLFFFGFSFISFLLVIRRGKKFSFPKQTPERGLLLEKKWTERRVNERASEGEGRMLWLRNSGGRHNALISTRCEAEAINLQEDDQETWYVPWQQSLSFPIFPLWSRAIE